jgi:TolB protein
VRLTARRARTVLLACCGLAATVSASSSGPKDAARLWQPDRVSTEKSEVRITFSPDGARMLWGTIGGTGGAGGWDIFESRRAGSGWTAPEAVSFNSAANDFDPSFAPDGSGVYFFSNREGGSGKDDLYFSAFDAKTGRYAAAANLGPEVNSAGDDWAPVVSPDGTQLLFATDGRGGKGRHDLFVARRQGSLWVEPKPVDALNSAEEDFDATFLPDGRSIVFSRGDLQGTVALYLSRHANGALQAPVRMDDTVNSTEPGAWTFGPSVSPHDPGALYVTSQRAEKRGRADIYRIELAAPK